MDMDIVDIHTHILPEVDDGPETPEESLELLRMLNAQGVKRAITTPHWGRITRKNPGEIREAFEKVKEALQKDASEIELHLGFEVFLDLETIQAIEREPRGFSLAGGDYILVEFPFEFFYPNWEILLKRIRETGLTPVVAHPERYFPVMNEPFLLKRMKQEGALLQVNAESLLGHNGGGAKKIAFSCIKDGLCDMVASDAHGVRFRPPYIEKAFKMIMENFGRATAERLFLKTPAMVLGEVQ